MSGSSVQEGTVTRWQRLAPWLVVAGLLLFHAINNWIWLADNVTSTGWDEARHLTYSVHYSNILNVVNIRSLFEVMIGDPVRPPLFPASATPLYRLFGYSADVATMVNVFYMAVVLLATYGIGKRWNGRYLGLISVALLACFPMFYGMLRHFYIEFALMAMVALSIYLLLATRGFQSKGLSLLFGLSLGLSLITKRTAALFLVGPVIVAILTSGLLPMGWQRLKRRPRLYWKKALLALVGGLGLAALWYVPNRETAQTLALGDMLFFFWWALAGLAIYFITLPSSPLANALAAFFLAAGVASTWYLARVEFVQRLALYGYGIGDSRGRALRLDSLDTYLYYLRALGNRHLSFAFFVVLIIVVVMAVVLFVRRQGSLRQALRGIKPEGWVTLAWAGGGYLLLTLSIYHETRAFTPVLPAVALIFGAALLKLPWQRFRRALLVVLLGFGLLQFLVLSYEAVNRLLPPRIWSLPVWGLTSSFAQASYIQLPDEGITDHAYWIEPDVLQRMEKRRQVLGEELLSLGLLVNTRQINSGHFGYLILTEYPHLRVESAFSYLQETPSFYHLFAHDYVMVKRENADTSASEKEAIQALLDRPPRLFAQTFELDTSYLLPDGAAVYLYRQRYPLPVDYPVEYVSSLAEQLAGRTRAGDAILLTAPELAAPFASHYSGLAEIYLVPETEEELAEIATQHPRLFLLIDDLEDHEAHTGTQDWLNQHGFWVAHEWVGGLQLLTYGTEAGPPAIVPTVDVSATLGDQIELVGYDLPMSAWLPGDILPLTLFWKPSADVMADYRVFVHLLDADGRLVAQTDTAPVGGSRPTTSWTVGEMVRDPVGILLPPDAASGEYRLVVGMYNPDTGERLPVVINEQAEPIRGDSIPLSTIQVREP